MDFRPSVLLLVALAAVASAKVSYRDHQVLRVPTPTDAEAKIIYDIVEGHPEFKYSMWHDPRPGSFADVMTGEVESLIRELEEAGLKHSVFIEDVGELHENNMRLIEERRKVKQLEKKEGGRASDDYDLNNYNTLEDIYQYLVDLSGD